MFTIPLNYIGDPEASIIGGFRKSYHYNLIISPKKSLTTRIIELQKISPKLLTFLGLEDIIRLKKPASVTISRLIWKGLESAFCSFCFAYLFALTIN